MLHLSANYYDIQNTRQCMGIHMVLMIITTTMTGMMTMTMTMTMISMPDQLMPRVLCIHDISSEGFDLFYAKYFGRTQDNGVR